MGLGCPVSVMSQVWNTATQVADAYQIGRVESNAALNLHSKVDADIVERLSFLVRREGAHNSPNVHASFF